MVVNKTGRGLDSTGSEQGPVTEFCEDGSELYDSVKRQRVSSPGERPSVQDGLRSMELISRLV